MYLCIQFFFFVPCDYSLNEFYSAYSAEFLFLVFFFFLIYSLLSTKFVRTYSNFFFLFLFCVIFSTLTIIISKFLSFIFILQKSTTHIWYSHKTLSLAFMHDWIGIDDHIIWLHLFLEYRISTSKNRQKTVLVSPSFPDSQKAPEST